MEPEGETKSCASTRTVSLLQVRGPSLCLSHPGTSLWGRTHAKGYLTSLTQRVPVPLHPRILEVPFLQGIMISEVPGGLEPFEQKALETTSATARAKARAGTRLEFPLFFSNCLSKNQYQWSRCDQSPLGQRSTVLPCFPNSCPWVFCCSSGDTCSTWAICFNTPVLPC